MRRENDVYDSKSRMKLASGGGKFPTWENAVRHFRERLEKWISRMARSGMLFKRFWLDLGETFWNFSKKTWICFQIDQPHAFHDVSGSNFPHASRAHAFRFNRYFFSHLAFTWKGFHDSSDGISRWDYVSFLYFYLQQLEDFLSVLFALRLIRGKWVDELFKYHRFYLSFFLFVLIITQILGGTMGVLWQRLLSDMNMHWSGGA